MKGCLVFSCRMSWRGRSSAPSSPLPLPAPSSLPSSHQHQHQQQQHFQSAKDLTVMRGQRTPLLGRVPLRCPITPVY